MGGATRNKASPSGPPSQYQPVMDYSIGVDGLKNLASRRKLTHASVKETEAGLPPTACLEANTKLLDSKQVVAASSEQDNGHC